jgi:hypothetical protein
MNVHVREEAEDAFIGHQGIAAYILRCNQNRVSQAKAKAQSSLAHSGQNEQHRQEFYSSAANGEC